MYPKFSMEIQNIQNSLEKEKVEALTLYVFKHITKLQQLQECNLAQRERCRSMEYNRGLRNKLSCFQSVKQTVPYPGHETLFSYKKESNIDTCSNWMNY